MGQYLERYLAGACQSVWDELLAQGAAVRQEPLASDAWAVAQETMRRVRHNIELLIPRLRTLGYRFGEIPGGHHFGENPWDRPDATVQYWPEDGVFQPPPPDAGRILDELEQRVGPLPLSLRAFYLAIGEVNLVGTHPTLHPDRLNYDPLLMYPLDAVAHANPLEEDLEDLEELVEEGVHTQLICCPDVLHKYNTRGADPYFMMVPNANVDGVFYDGWHNVPFVEYLRLCLRSGGLMDMDKSEQVEDVAEALAYLRKDLLPI